MLWGKLGYRNRLGVEPQPDTLLLAVWYWTSHLIFLYCSFLIYTIDINILYLLCQHIVRVESVEISHSFHKLEKLWKCGKLLLPQLQSASISQCIFWILSLNSIFFLLYFYNTLNNLHRVFTSYFNVCDFSVINAQFYIRHSGWFKIIQDTEGVRGT